MERLSQESGGDKKPTSTISVAHQAVPAVVICNTSTPTVVTTSVSHSSSSSTSSSLAGSGRSASACGSTSSIGTTTQGTIERLLRPMAFDKMESLVREMQNPDGGVPVRCQKLFLTTIPNVFMGYDLVDWLMERLGIEECEALNIAFQLCLHGYLFPVSDWKNLFVKDDSTFYRFQSPYYWPCQQKAPDNIEYSIYLVKRTMRSNKQKHGLDDYELEALSNYHKNLKGKWELINMQAEEQVKIMKEWKKSDRAIADSQERAYWRVHRPPPGQYTPLEPCPVPSRTKPRKKTGEDWIKEVDMLKNSVTRTRMKMSQACESLVQYYETYADYDPLMGPAQPSNPWVTDDITFWQFNAPYVEVFSEKRVKKWAISIEDCVNDPTGLQEFTAYLKKEFSHENIRFWISVNELRRTAQSQIPKKVKEIYEEFLKPGAPCEINIDGKTMEQVQQGLKNPSRFTFDIASEHVYTLLLKKDCYPRFVRSEHYKSLLANAVQPSSKKRFFGFGGAAKKKGSTTQPPNTSFLSQGQSSISAVANIARRRGSDRSLTGSAHELAISGVKDNSKVPHSHSQSNLSEINYGETKFSTKLEVSIEAPCSAVCPWDEPDEVVPVVAEIKPTPDAFDVSDVSDKMKKSCKLRQQNTLDSDFHSSKRLLPASTEHRRASMTNATEFTTTTQHIRTSSFSDSIKLQEQVAVTQKPLLHETSISTPLLVIEHKNIQACTIPEESSRANSEANIHEKLKSETTSLPPSASSCQTVETDKSSSQSSLPIINVSDAADDEEPEVIQEEIKIKSERTVEHKEPIVEEEEEEKTAAASIPEEQTLSRENIPGVIKKLSIQSEEQLLQEQAHKNRSDDDEDDEQELQSDISGGYVPPAPTPAPSLAPLAQVELDPETDFDLEPLEVPQHIDAEVVQACSSGEHGDTHHHKKRKKKKDTAKEAPTKGDPVCPWEDEDDNTVETPFVKTYSTLGYL